MTTLQQLTLDEQQEINSYTHSLIKSIKNLKASPSEQEFNERLQVTYTISSNLSQLINDYHCRRSQ